ncbi:MAG: hypothetical protein R3F59_36600 [Myxococcota bacterium]
MGNDSGSPSRVQLRGKLDVLVRRALTGPVLGALACSARVELPDVPVVGGTPETRGIVQAELERFNGWIGPGRLEIREVRFEALEDPLAGQWRPGAGVVRVGEDVAPSGVADVVRHELCHALDDAEHLSDSVPSFARLGRAYPQYELRTGEAFAVFCGGGPLATATVTASSCPDDDPAQLAAFTFLADEVWTGDVPQGTNSLGDPLGGFALDQGFEPVTSWIVLPTTDPDRLSIALTGASGTAEAEADFTTGERLQSEHLPLVLGPDELPPGLFGAPAVFVKRGSRDGPGAAVLTWPMRNQPWLPPRLVAYDGQAWRPVADTCPGADGTFYGLFTARDQIWFARDDGEAIDWAPLDLP